MWTRGPSLTAANEIGARYLIHQIDGEDVAEMRRAVLLFPPPPSFSSSSSSRSRRLPAKLLFSPADSLLNQSFSSLHRDALALFFFFLFFFCFFLVFFLLPSASSTIRSASLWFIFFLSYRVHWSATQLLIEGFIFQLDPIELVGDFFFFFFLFLGSSFQFLVAQLWFLFRSTSFIEGVMKRRWSRSMFTVFNDIAVP